MAVESGDWNEYRLLVLANFETVNRKLDSIERRLRKIEISQAVTKTKLALWSTVFGLAGGLIVAIVAKYF